MCFYSEEEMLNYEMLKWGIFNSLGFASRAAGGELLSTWTYIALCGLNILSVRWLSGDKAKRCLTDIGSSNYYNKGVFVNRRKNMY